MRARCVNHLHYVKKGITVCPRWEVFDAFFADMGERPTGKTIDRIDGDKGYYPGNCRWASAAEQAANRPGTVLSIDEKAEIHRLDALGSTQRAIATALGRDPATIRRYLRSVP